MKTNLALFVGAILAQSLASAAAGDKYTCKIFEADYTSGMIQLKQVESKVVQPQQWYVAEITKRGDRAYYLDNQAIGAGFASPLSILVMKNGYMDVRSGSLDESLARVEDVSQLIAIECAKISKFW